MGWTRLPGRYSCTSQSEGRASSLHAVQWIASWTTCLSVITKICVWGGDTENFFFFFSNSKTKKTNRMFPDSGVANPQTSQIQNVLWLFCQVIIILHNWEMPRHTKQCSHYAWIKHYERQQFLAQPSPLIRHHQGWVVRPSVALNWCPIAEQDQLTVRRNVKFQNINTVFLFSSYKTHMR